MVLPVKRGRIFTQLLIKILPLVVLSLAAVAYLIFLSARDNLQQEVLRGLNTISQRHTRQIDHYILERQKDMQWLSQSGFIRKALPGLEEAYLENSMGSLKYRLWDTRVRNFLSTYLEIFGYQDLYLISMNGEVLFSIQQRTDLGTNLRSGEFQNSQLAQVYVRAVTLLETEISQLDYYPPLKGPAGFIAAPVFDGSRFVGVVALQINNQELYKTVNDYTGLGQTGESLVAAKLEEGFLFVAPTRFDPKAAFKRKVMQGDQPGPLEKALDQQEGSGLAVDYRGENVLAVWSYLPSVQWGIVVKIDAEEAFASIARVQTVALILGAWFVLIGITVILKSARDITLPIYYLQSVTHQVAEGDLSRRVVLKDNNELKDLGDMFNTMTERLQDYYQRLSQSHRDIERQSEELKEANRALKASNENLDHFAMIAAHDLKEPLRKIVLFSHSLEAAINKNPEETVRLVNRINKAANRMHKFLEDLLEFSRATFHDRPTMAVPLRSLVKSVLGILEERITKCNGRVEIGPLPRIKVDVFHMKRVFQNLIANSLKFCKKGLAPVILIYARQGSGGSQEIVVEDNGIGMDPLYSEKIFQPFERLHDRSVFEGTGLGLSFCRKIMESHGGDIRVESEPGKGSRFILRFPPDFVSEGAPPREMGDPPPTV